MLGSSCLGFSSLSEIGVVAKPIGDVQSSTPVFEGFSGSGIMVLYHSCSSVLSVGDAKGWLCCHCARVG